MKFLTTFILSLALSCKAAVLSTGTNTAWIELPPGGASPVITNFVSISCWITLGTNYLTSSYLGSILDRGRTTASPSDSLYALRVFTNRFQFQYMVSGAFHRYVPNQNLPELKTPTHLAVTYTYGTGSSIQFYINGVLVSGGWHQGDGNSIPPANSNPLWYMSDGVGNNFVGTVNEVGIWNSILSYKQIQCLFNRQKGLPLQVSPSTLILYSPLDDQPALIAATETTTKGLGSSMNRGSIEGFGALSTWYEFTHSFFPNE